MAREPKQRLDVFLVEQGFFPTREKARAAVMAGLVETDGQLVYKAGHGVTATCRIRVKEPEYAFVSRGGLKLARALQVFPINLQGLTILDVGASTGGFTDCALQNGARHVFAVDVGYGQLDWKLRQDERVTVLERTNIRYLTLEQLGTSCDLATIDVSFISLSKVLPAVIQLLAPSGKIIALIKPQFEAGREKVGKKGVVRDPVVHTEVIDNVCQAARGLGLGVEGLSYSPVRGPEGNIEYLVYLGRDAQDALDLPTVEQVVAEAHQTL